MRVLIVIPAYNEEKSILKVYNSILRYNEKNSNSYDVIIINDGSIDNTEKILIENSIPHIKLVSNLGIGGAVQTGYKYAYEHGYDIAVQFDGDGQHDIKYVKKIIDPIINNECDMSIGSRFIDSSSSDFKSSAARRAGINIISFFIKLLTKEKIYDTTSGFRAINKKIIEFFSNDYPVEYPEPVSTTQVLKKNFKILEIPVSMNEREDGVSSIRAWKNIYYMFNVILSIIVFGIRRNTK